MGVLGGSAGWSPASGTAAPTLSEGLFRAYDFVDGSGSQFAGLALGYNHRRRSGLVIGAEGDVSFGAEPIGGRERFSESAALFGTVRGRLGYAVGRWLPFGTGGLAWTREQLARTDPAAGAAARASVVADQRVGWTVGAGVERALTARWRADVEYRYAQFGDADVALAPDIRITSALSTQQVRIGLNYAIDRDMTSSDAPLGLAALDVGGWSAHAQTTYISQYAAPFHAPYRGPNSLDSNASRETWDVTFYLGRRLWPGAALWINPEIDQGYGLSDTLGVAGFTSGEAYKVGYTHPYVRLPRFFVQQTIDRGGASETVDAGLNQFRETRTANRVVVTAGRFSVSDLFDTISYAHDPRSDFMNWSLVDAGTFDYAADAWGFTYGAAVEWYQGAWTVRGGLFDLSNVPNSADLDSGFHQQQLVYEIERRHDVRGQPGKIAVVGFLSHGRMASYTDALALAAATGAAPDTAAVRRVQQRPGINVNVAQQLTPDVGVFARAGWADGSVEPYEFTDIDRTASLGLSLDGRRWARQADTVGVAAVVSGISDVHRAYLAAGGLGILVGDGRLPHAGPESIVESYYRVAVGPWQLTGDYQFITNPAFNLDRGPVSVVSLRLRTQF